MAEMIGLESLIKDYTVYPRDRIVETNVTNMIKALEVGIALPPIVVDRATLRIVDGFHRYLVMLNHADIRERTESLLPVVVIDKNANERMASTVRHNRARGKHQVNGMAGIVFTMLDNGMNDESICSELGLEAEELIRLKYVTGFAKLFEDVGYKRSWETRRQIRLRRDYVDDARK